MITRKVVPAPVSDSKGNTSALCLEDGLTVQQSKAKPSRLLGFEFPKDIRLRFFTDADSVICNIEKVDILLFWPCNT